MNKDKVLTYLIKKDQCCALDYDELELKELLESGEFKDALDIATDWLDCVLDGDSIKTLAGGINELDEKDFCNIIDLVNKHLGDDNKDGDFDGVAMELEEYYENWGEFEDYGE